MSALAIVHLVILAAPIDGAPEETIVEAKGPLSRQTVHDALEDALDIADGAPLTIHLSGAPESREVLPKVLRAAEGMVAMVRDQVAADLRARSGVEIEFERPGDVEVKVDDSAGQRQRLEESVRAATAASARRPPNKGGGETGSRRRGQT